MAAGDFLVRRNNADTTSVPNEGGGNVDALWDTEVFADGAAATYSAGTFTLDIGKYLVIYNEEFNTTNTTNNERNEIQGELIVGGGVANGGYGQGYIRKSSGAQSAIVFGAAILDITSNGTSLLTRFYRTDNSTSGTVDRVPGAGGVQILELDDADNFARYSMSGTQVVTTTEQTVPIDTTAEEDTGFVRAGSTITINTSGRYLFVWSGDGDQTGTGRGEFVFFWERGTTPIAARAGCYVRGGDGCQDGAFSGIALVDVTAGDTFTLRSDRVSGSDFTLRECHVQIWQLPSGNTTCQVEATTGNLNAASNTPFIWDTLIREDGARFTYNGTDSIDVTGVDHVLLIANAGKTAVDSVQRSYPVMQLGPAGNPLPYGQGGRYHRNSSSTGQFLAMTAAALGITVGGSMQMMTRVLGATGTTDCDIGQFSAISLSDLGYRSYAFPASITSVNGGSDVPPGAQDVPIAGASFGAVQGTGFVEVADGSDYATATKITQSIDSWSDELIVFDLDTGVFAEGTVYLFVTIDGGTRTAGFPFTFGEASYVEVLESTNPDHLWMFDGDFTDLNTSGLYPVRPANNALNAGGPTFPSQPICRNTTQSAFFSGGGTCEPANSGAMNEGTPKTRRTMGGWMMIDSIQQELVVVYEEGATVRNYAFLLGIGNTLLAQGTTTDGAGFTIQAFSDTPIVPNRPYHVLFTFSGSGFENVFTGFVDGQEVQRVAGNPPNLTTLGNHSGDITFGGGTGGALEVGGTTVQFGNPTGLWLAGWGTWAFNVLSDTVIREDLFEAGAIADIFVTGDTATIQAAVAAQDDTNHQNWPLTYKINAPSDAGNLEVTMTNQVFDPLTTLHARWMGSGQLSVRTVGTTNFDPAKVSLPFGGTVVTISAASITITVSDINTGLPIENARVRIVADTGGPLPVNTVILDDSTDVNGQVTASIDYTADQPITGRARKGSASPYYKTGVIGGTITVDGFESTTFLVPDE